MTDARTNRERAESVRAQRHAEGLVVRYLQELSGDRGPRRELPAASLGARIPRTLRACG
jgi:hypothetical protein